MRRPHVYERSAPRVGRSAYHESVDQAAIARTIATQLGHLIDKADKAGLTELSGLLELARLKAEKVADP